MLRLEAPRDLLQITNGTPAPDQAIEVANPAIWLRSMVRLQRQAENDLRQLTQLCGNTIDPTDQRMLQIEEAYQTLLQGTRYIYDRVNANEEIAEAWVRSELANAANVYETLAQNVWQAILDRTQEDNQRQICQATQLTRVNDARAFLAEANMARSQHLVTFQGNVELWATDHQRKVNRMEGELQQARDEIQRIATRIPLPGSPTIRIPSPEPPHAWRSPVRPPSTSVATVPTGPPPPPALRSPLRFAPAPPTRRLRRPAISATSSPAPPPHTTPELRQRLEELRRHASPRPPAPGPAGVQGGSPPSTPPQSSRGPPSGPPSEPPCPPFRQPRSPSPPRDPRPQITTQDLVRLVAEGVTAARAAEGPRPDRPRTARLKMENPQTFDGKPSTSFNTWWKSVTKYLSFYPETDDGQKIAWLGTRLTGTAKAWDLHRYDTLGEEDTWVNYSAAIRAEYENKREAGDAQIKLGQLKYTGDIRAYFTEFRALNNYARATGEGLHEKVDLAMTSEILRMRFAHFLGEFADDEGFLAATYQAGLQVERMKALEKARKNSRATRTDNRKKDGQGKGNPDNTRKGKQGIRTERKGNPPTKKGWGNVQEVLKGVPQSEIDTHKKDRENCWRCGRPGHRTFDCYAFTTAAGTSLPKAPWKVAAVTKEAPAPPPKRKRDEESEPLPAAKQQKVAAVEEMTTDPPLWASEEDSDF